MHLPYIIIVIFNTLKTSSIKFILNVKAEMCGANKNQTKLVCLDTQ